MIPEPENNEQRSRARRKKRFRPKFEVEVEIEMEMKMGHSWNERGYRLQHPHFQERPTINGRKKTPRTERPVCSVSELMNYPKQNPPQKKTVNSKVLPNPHKTTHRKKTKKTVMTTTTAVSSPSHPHSIPSSNPFQKQLTSTISHSSQTASKQSVLFLLRTNEPTNHSSRVDYSEQQHTIQDDLIHDIDARSKKRVVVMT